MKLGLGTVQLGLGYGIANRSGKPDARRAQAILRAAVRGGAGCFDTAAAYGDSEDIIGNFFKSETGLGGAPRPLISTKFSDISTAGEEMSASLKRLGVDRLDYFLLHRPAQVFEPGFGEAMARLAQSPHIGKAGVSVYGAGEIRECLKHDVRVLQIPFSIIDTRLIESGLAGEIKARGIELHARSVYLQGLLLADAPQKPRGARPYIGALAALARKYGLTRKELCFVYVRDCPYIDRFFIGCETEEQVAENLAMYALPPLPGGAAEEARRLFAGVPEGILDPSRWNAGR